jgi:sugar lactone lactonase YvrE
MKAELLSSSLPLAELGEGPCWDRWNGLLYWVDITGQRVHSFDLQRGMHSVYKTASTVGFVALNAQGGLVAGLQDGIYRLDIQNGRAEQIAAPKAMPSCNRFNDGKCDAAGRLWCGTMNLDTSNSVPTGSLYRLGKGGLAEFERDIFISNGLGWSPDNSIMYYTDTLRQTIWRYDYDFSSGLPSRRREFLKKELPGRPDGMCVDSAGRVLTALWGGWGVEIYSPDGKLEDRIDVPVPQASCCAFGGADLKTLFITSARSGLTADELHNAPLSGAVFAVEMEIPGMPGALCRTDLP